MHTRTGMIGYTTKDATKEHYVMTSKNVTEQARAHRPRLYVSRGML